MSRRLIFASNWNAQVIQHFPERWPLGYHCFSTGRAGGHSLGCYASLNLGSHVGDQPEHVSANRAELNQLLPAPARWLEQVHGAKVIYQALEAPITPPQADAAWTDQPNVVLAVLSADCMPIVVADPDSGRIGIAHAGWRSLVLGVIEQLLEAMAASANSQVWIAPAIHAEAFCIGEEVAQQLIHHPEAAALCQRRPHSQQWHADLPQLAMLRLRQWGLSHISANEHCTYQNPALFSHRRQAPTGRQATVVWRSGAFF